jgi:hypothetical protein
MNRTQLFREAWSILKRNPALWSVALIGLTADFIASWLALAAPPAAAVLRTLLAFAVAAFTTGALISMVNVIADGQAVTFIDGLQAGFRRFVPLLAVSGVLFLPVWIAIFFLSGSVMTIFTSGLGQPGGIQATDVLSLIASFLSTAGLVVALSVIANVIGIGAERAVVLDDAPVSTALKQGWQLLLTKARDYLSIGVMLFGVVLAIGLVFAFVIGPLLNALAAGLSSAGDTPAPATLLLSPANVIFIVISLVINSLFAVFTTSVWTLIYREWRPQAVAMAARDQDRL